MTEANIAIEDLVGSTKTIKIVHVSGQLDESNVDEKIQVVYKLLEGGTKDLNLIFDLANLEYMNSKSIGYLTDLYGKVTETGGRITIVSARPNIFDILQVVGLTQLIQTFATTEEAKLSIESASAQTALASTPASAPVTTPVVESVPTPAPAVAVEPVVAAEPVVAVESVAAPEPVAAPAEPFAVTPAPAPAVTETPAAANPAPTPAPAVPSAPSAPTS